MTDEGEGRGQDGAEFVVQDQLISLVLPDLTGKWVGFDECCTEKNK